MRPTALLLVAAVAMTVSPAEARQRELDISLANDSERERRTEEQLRDIVGSHDLRNWIRTREILIDQDQTPHSHPVLTLHTRHLGDDPQLLSTFVHEQFHWLVIESPDALRAAEAEFERMFPEVPDRPNGGARDRESTYLHLVVCDLEFQAITLLLGDEAARDTLERFNHYEWIYDRVLNDDRVREVLERHGFILE